MHENFLTRLRTLGRKDLPEGYTQPYKNARQADENVYDRYDTEYEGGETPDRKRENGSCAPKKSCCKIGRLSNNKNRAGYNRTESPSRGLDGRLTESEQSEQKVDSLLKSGWSGLRKQSHGM